MREFKFKAWDKKNKKMHDVMSILDIMRPGVNKYRVITTNGEMIEEAELLQYAERLDKNKKEIYEGAILKIWGGTDYQEIAGPVVLDIGRDSDGYQHDYWFGWKCVRESHKGPPYDDFSLQDIYSDAEVIGNIHGSPELLNGNRS